MSQLSTKQLESTVGGVVALIAVVTGVAYFRSKSTAIKPNSLAASGISGLPGAGPPLGPNAGPPLGPNAGPNAGPLGGPPLGPSTGPPLGPNTGPPLGPSTGPPLGPDDPFVPTTIPSAPPLEIDEPEVTPLTGADPTQNYFNIRVPTRYRPGDIMRVKIDGSMHDVPVSDDSGVIKLALPKSAVSGTTPGPKPLLFGAPHAPIAGKRVSGMVEIQRPSDVKDGDVVDINDDTGKFVGKLIIPTGSLPGGQIYFDIPSDPYRVPVNAVPSITAQQRLSSSGAEESPLASFRPRPGSGFGRLASVEEDFPGRPYTQDPGPLRALPEGVGGNKTTKPKKSTKKTRKNRKILNQLKKLLKEI